MAPCAEHPDRSAEFWCPECRFHFCSQCVDHRFEKDGFTDYCRRCGGVADTLEREVEIDRSPGGFLGQLGAVLLFPLGSNVRISLAGLALFNALLWWAITNNISPAGAGLGLIFVRALEASMYFHWVRRTAFGTDDPGPPDFTEPASDLFAPLIHYVVALSPLLAGLVWATLAAGKPIFAIANLDAGDAAATPGALALIIGGIALLPLTTSIAALQGRARDVLNPLTWVVMLYRMGAAYWIAAVLFYALYALENIVLAPLMTELESVPVLGTWMALLLCYLTMAMRARLLGALCRPHVPR